MNDLYSIAATDVENANCANYKKAIMDDHSRFESVTITGVRVSKSIPTRQMEGVLEFRIPLNLIPDNRREESTNSL